MSSGKSLGAIDVPSVLRVLGSSGRSGVLSVNSGDQSAVILLEDGRIAFASCDGVERLGTGLVRKGLLTDDTLDKVLLVQRRKKVRQLLGTILTELGLVSRSQATGEISNHVVAVLREVCLWRDAEAHFEEACPTERLLPREHGDVETLLLKAIGKRKAPRGAAR